VLAATSALPVVAIAAVVVISASFITIPRLLRAVGAPTIVSDTPDPGTYVANCGFNLVKPGRLTSSLGTCTLRVSDDNLAVRTPLGDYRWNKASASLSPVRRRAFWFTFRVLDQHTEAEVFVRDGGLLSAALDRHDWETTAA